MTDNSPADPSTHQINPTGVNSPAIDPKTMEVQMRAIRDGKQAWDVFSYLFQNNSNRTKVNAEIVSIYNGRQPKDPEKLKADGRDWESNFPTLFLAGIVDRVVPNLVNAIDSSRYLTQAKLKFNKDDQEQVKKYTQKTAFFRDLFTDTLRDWSEWRNFVYSLCQEIILIGYAFVVWTDEDDPFPTFVRQDKIALPEGTPQYARGVQIFGYKQPLLVHEFVDIIKDKKSAEDQGWDLDNCVLTANDSLPYSPTSDRADDEVRSFQDIIREGNPGASYTQGAKIVELGHLFAIEPKTKMVSHFIVDRNNSGRVLYERMDRFDEMGDVIQPFTLEPGNGKVHGSKGLGRMLSNYAVAVDAATNDAVDQVRVGGNIIARTDSKGAIESQIRVRKPFIVVNSEMKLEQIKLESDPKAFVELYSQLGKMAETSAGAYIPNLISSETPGRDKTAREATIDYTREVESKTAFVIRFRGQFGDALQPVQKRLCKKHPVDDIAKEFQKRLKEEGEFTDAEIEEISKSPVSELAQDLSSIEAQQKVAIYDKFAGNPFIDQTKTLMAALIAMSDPDFAMEIVLPDAVDPTLEVEQLRQQIIENAAIMTGESVPVSPRDVDEVHVKFIISELQKAFPKIMQNIDQLHQTPELLDHIHAGMMHGEAHVDQMRKKKANPQTIQQAGQFFGGVDKMLIGLTKKLQQDQAQAHQAINQQEAQAQQEAAAQPNAPENAPLPLTEKVLVAWIGQYDKLPDDEKRKLETVGGLGASMHGLITPQPGSPEHQALMPPPPSLDDASGGDPSAPAGPPPPGDPALVPPISAASTAAPPSMAIPGDNPDLTIPPQSVQ